MDMPLECEGTGPPDAAQRITLPGLASAPPSLPSVRARLSASRLRRSLAARLRRFPRLQALLLAAVTTVGLTCAQHLFYRLVPTVNDGWAVYWPFNGILIAILLLSRRRFWSPVIAGFICAFVLAQLQAGDPIAEIATVVLGNLAQVMIAAFCLPPFRSLKQWLLEPHLQARLILYSVVLGPLLTAFPVGYYFSSLHPGSFWSSYIWWAFSDALGAAVWTPFVLVLYSRETYQLFHWRALPQTLALLLILCAVTAVTFNQEVYHLSFLSYPLLLFVALRLGFSGAVIGVNLLTGIVASRSMHTVGPFRLASSFANTDHTLVLQLYCIFAALLVFPLSVAMVGRRDLEDRLRQAFQDMKQLATVDPLTGLANRRQFDQALDHEWRRAVRSSAPVGLLMIDADCFKAYNDLYGHVAGDDCLRQIARILSASAVRRHDLIARYGGEEFAILLPGSDPHHLHEIAAHLCSSVCAAALPHEKSPHRAVTISVGCTLLVPQLHQSPLDLVEAADRALYQAKREGRNRVHCNFAAATFDPDPYNSGA